MCPINFIFMYIRHFGLSQKKNNYLRVVYESLNAATSFYLMFYLLSYHVNWMLLFIGMFCSFWDDFRENVEEEPTAIGKAPSQCAKQTEA